MTRTLDELRRYTKRLDQLFEQKLAEIERERTEARELPQTEYDSTGEQNVVKLAPKPWAPAIREPDATANLDRTPTPGWFGTYRDVNLFDKDSAMGPTEFNTRNLMIARPAGSPPRILWGRYHHAPRVRNVDLAVAQPNGKGEEKSPILTRCSVCEKKRRARWLCVLDGRGYCGKHYRGHPRHLDPGRSIAQQLLEQENKKENETRGSKTVMIAADAPSVWIRKGAMVQNGVRLTSIQRVHSYIRFPQVEVEEPEDALTFTAEMSQQSLVRKDAWWPEGSDPSTHRLRKVRIERVVFDVEVKDGEITDKKIDPVTVVEEIARCEICGHTFSPEDRKELQQWMRDSRGGNALRTFVLDEIASAIKTAAWRPHRLRTRLRLRDLRRIVPTVWDWRARVVAPPVVTAPTAPRTRKIRPLPSVLIDIGETEESYESNVVVVGGARAVTQESGGYFKLQDISTGRLVWRSDWDTWGDLPESTRQRALAMETDFPMGTESDDPLPCLFFPPSDAEELNRVTTERKTDYARCPICGCGCGMKVSHKNHHPLVPSRFSFDRNLTSKPITFVEPGARPVPAYIWSSAVKSMPANIEIAVAAHLADRADIASHMREQEEKRRTFIRHTRAFDEAEAEARAEVFGDGDNTSEIRSIRVETKNDVSEHVVRIWRETFGESHSPLYLQERAGAVRIATDALDYLPKHTRHNVIAASAVIAFWNRNGKLEDTDGRWYETQRIIRKLAGVSGKDFSEVYREVIDIEQSGIAYAPEVEAELRAEADYYRSWGFEDGKPPVPRVRSSKITDEGEPKIGTLSKAEKALVEQVKKPEHAAGGPKSL